MIFVDSSVWIDHFNDKATPQRARLNLALNSDTVVVVGDVVLMEVLQGFRYSADFEIARRLLLNLELIEVGGVEIALKAAANYRHLRALGVTVRRTIDCLIATRCIEEGLPLLYADRDFDPFVEHLGLARA